METLGNTIDSKIEDLKLQLGKYDCIIKLLCSLQTMSLKLQIDVLEELKNGQ